jgi:phage repressor protein C with HTH and peptisase S24 domain
MADFQGDDDIIPVFAFSVTDAGEVVRKAVGSKIRPPLLQAVRDAYAIYMPDESMEPRYRRGWLLWVNPVKPVSEGRDALVFPKDGVPTVRQIERARGKLIGRALKRGATVTLANDTNRHLIVGADQEG